MKLANLKSEIMGHDIRDLYIFVGEEIGIMDIYIQQMSKETGLQVARRDTVQDVVRTVNNSGFFANEPRLYLVRGDNQFPKSDNEKFWDINLAGSQLILLYDKLDSRTKFAKKFKDCTVQFEKLDRPVIAKYIQRICPLTLKYAEGLSEICGDSYDISMRECEKINTYQRATGLKHDTCFKRLVQDGTIYQSVEYNVFQFTDAVCKRDLELAFDIATSLTESGTSSIAILGTLYNTLKSIMLIKAYESGGSNGSITDITGLDKGSIFFNKKYKDNFDIGTLLYSIKLISGVVADIKVGNIKDAYAVEYVLISIF